MSSNRDKAVALIEKLYEVRPDDPFWKSMITVLCSLSELLSNYELLLLSSVVSDLTDNNDPYSLASFIVIRIAKADTEGFDLQKRWINDNIPTEDEMDQVMDHFKILDTPRKTQLYAIALTVNYRLGPKGRAVAILHSMAA
jgi:hypothetical protein